MSGEVLVVRGLFTGHDYLLGKDELIDIQLVSRKVKAVTVVIPVLIFLLSGGFPATIAFFAPALFYPLTIELICRFRRRHIEPARDITLLQLKCRMIRWSEVARIKFDGGQFVIFLTDGRKKFTGFTKNSNVKSMIGFLESSSLVKEIRVRIVNLSYAIASCYLVAFSYFMILQTPPWIPATLFLIALGLLTAFFTELIRSKTTVIKLNEKD